ncbi:DUF433 domain-containing protein [Candidatus Poribacteria bacterium]|nr:DUF433 domain-containing protein [Candidatus Poribacteria bacterium]
MKVIECVADMEPKEPLNKRVELGKYIVADPKIAFGKPTFKGTRKTPDGVLSCFQKGHTLAEAAQLWGVSQEAVIEALDLARKAIIEYYRVPAAEIDMSQFDEELQKAKVSVCHETSYP